MPKPAPAALAAETLKLLRSKANAKRAASYQRYFKEPVDYLGLDNPAAQQIKADVYARVKDHWTIRDAVRFCNWGLVDNLAPSVLAPLIDLHPELVPEVVSWTDSPNQWVRRGATVAFVPLVRRKKKHLGTAYRIASRLFDDEEDLMHKAVGWLLREAGKVDSDRLRTYLLKHGPKIPRTSVRYAIERFPKEERKKLLEATRG